MYKYQDHPTLSNTQNIHLITKENKKKKEKMAGTAVSFTVSLSIRGTKNLAPARLARFSRKLIMPKAAAEQPVVSYDSPISVFPGEACDLIGGEACNVQMFHETKLAADQSRNAAKNSVEEFEREYLQYDEPKTVFPGEACDDLGGEFCEAPYQSGVSK
ncbi:hypothetical protein LUZ60_013488 [Juncus effusus]|nr:hypothetical protein LUZ60_013488 [Juncus effusus]